MLFDWSRAGAAPTAPAGLLFDETLRDGIQAPHVGNPSLDEKLHLVDHMVRCGIRCADLGFPGSSPAAARDSLAIARHIAAQDHPLVPGFAGRTHPDDIRAICDVAQRAGMAVDAYIFIGISPIRLYVEDWTVDSIARDIRRAAADCRRDGVAFVLVLEDAVRCTPAILSGVYDLALELGITRITLCDTVGAAVPAGTGALVSWSTRYFAQRGHPVALEWHGHNDRGLALANSLTALAAGCARVHGTVLGIGERAGNASIDQLIVNGELDHAGRYDLKALREYCDYASRVLGVAVPGNYPAMGGDVFKTSAGVHAAAILKAHQKRDVFVKDSVYSGVPASLLGREQEVLVDPSSGASNVRYWFALHGGEPDEAVVQDVLGTAKRAGRPLTDEEIRRVVATYR
ncbi:MAG TPA: LeuA family protein [Rugosimonospora sp.]|nr:LeuA family protein [Rugosimonospora sp.]